MTPDLVMSLSRIHAFLASFHQMGKTPKQLANWLLEVVGPLTEDTPIELFEQLYSVRFVKTAALIALGVPVTQHKNAQGIVHRISLNPSETALQR